MSLARRLVAAVLAVLWTPIPVAAAAPWSWPVRGRVAARFSLGPDRFAPGQRRGIVIAAPAGTAVRAACGGTVTFAGHVADNGVTAAVACGSLSATYVHLGAVTVRRGARVARGERIGTVGASGRPRVEGPQVGLGARRRDGDRAYLDPLRLLGDPEASRPAAPAAPPPIRRPAVPAIPAPYRAPAPRLAPSRARPPSPQPAPAVEPGGDLPLGRVWLPVGAGLLAAGLGVARLGRAAGLARRKLRRRRGRTRARVADRPPMSR